MERGYLLSILYEMALVIGGEVSVKPLLTKTLQRLLYNTSFPAGFVCLEVPSSAADSEGMLEVCIDAAVGDYDLAGLIGQKVRLPAQLLRGATERGEDAALLAALPDKVNRYKAYLRLPIDGHGVVVLLAPQLPDSDLPLTQLFQPVMANLAKAILLCSHHEAYTGGLIAARDASQQALAASEEKFRAISAAILDALIMVDNTSALVYWNPAAERILGYRADEVLGKPLHQLLIPQRYQSSADQGFAAFRSTGQGAVIGKTIEIEALHKDGHEIPVELSISALKLNGHWHAVGILRDISERKRAEQELHLFAAIVESSNDAIIGKTPDGIITSWNKGAERIYGYTADEIIGKLITTLAPPSRHAEIHELQEKIRQGGRVVNQESERIRKDGALIHVSLSLSPIKDVSGNITGISTIARDITEKKRMEEDLRQASVYNRSLIEASLDPLVTISVEGKITDVNQATEKVTGRSRSELIGMDFSDYFTEPDKAREGYQQVFAEGFVTDYPLALRHRDGHITEVLYNASIYRDEAGKVLGVFAAARDVTERNKAEQEVAQLSLQNKLILVSAGEGIYGMDTDGRCTFVNPAALQLLGFRVEELIGQHTHSIFHHTRPDGHPYPEEECPVQAACKQGAIHRGSDLYWRKDGSSFPVEFISTPILEAGEITGAVVTFRDITERKRAEEALRVNEERLKLATRAGNIGIWDWDVVRNMLAWDESMYALYGIRKEEFGGAYDAWIRTLHPDDRQFAEGEIQAALHGEREYAPEFRIIRPDGSVRNIKASSKTYYDPQGNPTRMIGTNFDITALKQIEDELRKYKDHLEEEVQLRTADLVLALNAAEAANRAKSVFLSSMSHELRTPLNAILGFSNLMRKDLLLSQEQRENLDIINRSGDHLLTLINDVLEMAKIEAGRVQLESTPFDLGGLVRDVTDLMHVRAQEQGLQLLVDQSSEFPRYIKGDEARLRQVLINLVSNAIKFTPQGGITVRFGMKPHATQQRLLIEVEDSGIGIKPEDQQKIFEPFVQLGQTATQKGTGLGLTLTRQFVQLMGGTISVESTPGKGSTFRVELPVEKVAAADVLKPESVGEGEIVSLAPGQPEYRILIAEDQLENQLLLATLMKSIGFPVKVAENGAQALRIFQSWRPHLIWMDRRMPVMDGLEATRRIRELPGGKEVKIVAVTASAFTEQRAEMLDAGMDGFVRKPYRFNEIYECLTRQLGVQYTYAETHPAEEVSDGVLTAEMLTVLPPDLRRELHDALESLDGERIASVIQQVSSHDAKLHRTLSHLAENYDYPAILKALQKNQPEIT